MLVFKHLGLTLTAGSMGIFPIIMWINVFNTTTGAWSFTEMFFMPLITIAAWFVALVAFGELAQGYVTRKIRRYKLKKSSRDLSKMRIVHFADENVLVHDTVLITQLYD